MSKYSETFAYMRQHIQNQFQGKQELQPTLCVEVHAHDVVLHFNFAANKQIIQVRH